MFLKTCGMKLLWLFIISATLTATAVEVRVVHFNIKELSSAKLRSPGKQLHQVKAILRDLPFDFLSVQEMQYDMPGVPSPSFQTRGQNPKKLLQFADRADSEFTVNFAPANTGAHARTRSNGHYYTDTTSSEARRAVDQINFGIYPGQYSTALISRFPVLDYTVYSDMTWKEFNPKIDLSPFKTATGTPLPSDMKLFDKNFNHVEVEIAGQIVHVISFHTVPTYHFGNPHSVNTVRNRDQLRFLEWYLTGKSDIAIDLSHIRSVAGQPFIAMGDWNVDFESNKPGSKILRRLLSHSSVRSWMDVPSRTYEAPGHRPEKTANGFRLYRLLPGFFHSRELWRLWRRTSTP